MHQLQKYCISLVYCFFSLIAAAQTPPALLIGNSAYLHATKLANPHQDVKSLTNALQRRGFDVTPLLDADHAQMQSALVVFLRKLAQTKKGVLYFAGHGVQLEGKNYLLPTDIRVANATTIQDSSLSLQALLDAVNKVSPEAVTIILDACRDNPFAENRPIDAPRGLGEAGQTIPKGVLVAYGASAGQSAIDSLGSHDVNPNGLFTRHLLRFLQDDTLSIQQVLRRVRDAVMTDAKTMRHRQIPSSYDASLPGQSLLTLAKNTVADPLPFLPKNIRLIIPYAAGGPTDSMARRFGERLKEAGVNMQIENTIDMMGERVAAMEYPFSADSVTLLLSNYSASLRRELANDRRFKAIGMIVETPVFLATNMQTGVRDMKTLMDRTRDRKMAWKVGVSGPASQSEACISVLKSTLGASRIDAISFPGMAPTLNGMLGGQVDLMCDIQPSFESWVKTGKLAYVANLQEDASSESDVLTSQSQGYAVVLPNWTALFAPVGLPAPMQTALTGALRNVVADPRFVSQLRQGGIRAVSPEKTLPIEVDMSLRLGAEISRQ